MGQDTTNGRMVRLLEKVIILKGGDDNECIRNGS